MEKSWKEDNTLQKEKKSIDDKELTPEELEELKTAFTHLRLAYIGLKRRISYLADIEVDAASAEPEVIHHHPELSGNASLILNFMKDTEEGWSLTGGKGNRVLNTLKEWHPGKKKEKEYEYVWQNKIDAQKFIPNGISRYTLLPKEIEKIKKV